jgi:ribosomal protein L37E
MTWVREDELEAKALGASMDGRTNENVPCETCGKATLNAGTKRCDVCWELEKRLYPYAISSPRALAFVAETLDTVYGVGVPRAHREGMQRAS